MGAEESISNIVGQTKLPGKVSKTSPPTNRRPPYFLAS